MEYMDSTDKNAIFTDDLKMMVHLATTQEDLDTTHTMIQRSDITQIIGPGLG